MNYKLLIIDDNQSEVAEIKDKNFSTQDYNIVNIYEKDFDKGLGIIENQNIDVLVLDLKKEVTSDYPGKEIFDDIWLGENTFIPIVVFSTNIDAVEKIEKHPLIYVFNKSEEEKVIKALEEQIFPKLHKINSFRKKINEYFREGLRVFAQTDETDSLHMMTQYVKNYLDNEFVNTAINPRIQYIILDEYKALYSCDILEKIVQDENIPKYCVIMTPSCDLQKKVNGEDVYIKDVFCKIIEEYTKESPSPTKFIKSHANNGGDQDTGIICLPNIKFNENAEFEKMYINVKKSFLIDQKKISLNPNEKDAERYSYRKIASISSPFRERIIDMCYGHLSRIGVPTLKKEGWW